MRRLGVHFGPWARSPLRLDPPVLRRMPAILLLIAPGLTAWVLELGAVWAARGAPVARAAEQRNR
jgi:hypothetical protein